MKKITPEFIAVHIPRNSEIIGDLPNFELLPCSIFEDSREGFCFIDSTRKDVEQLLENSIAAVILTPSHYTGINKHKNCQCLILVDEPKHVYARILNLFYSDEISNNKSEKTPTNAIIHPSAQIGSNTYIGNFSYVGNAIIGNNCILHGNIYIHDNVEIGDNVIINAGCVIGAEGFGYLKDNDELLNFPHIGKVKIGNDVHIGANTCIDRGALGTTEIQDGVKIDNLVHIAHNVIVGKNSMVIANAMVGGSTKIGANSYIAPSVSLRDVISIGDNTIVGMGAVVTKSVPENETWTGSPARPLSEFLTIQSKIKKL